MDGSEQGPRRDERRHPVLIEGLRIPLGYSRCELGMQPFYFLYTAMASRY